MKTQICKANTSHMMTRRHRRWPGAGVAAWRATRKCAYPLWLTAVLSAGSPQASAQGADAGDDSPATEEATSLTVSVVKAGGEDFDDQQRSDTPIGLRACIEGSIEVAISSLPSSPQFPYLEVWYGSGSGACHRGDRAARATAAQNCTKLTADSDGQPIVGSTSLHTKVQIGPVCELNDDQTAGGKQGPQTLWFLLLGSENSAEDARFYRAITLDIDTVAPEAPTNVKVSADEAEIRVTWDAPTTHAASFWVAAD